MNWHTTFTMLAQQEFALLPSDLADELREAAATIATDRKAIVGRFDALTVLEAGKRFADDEATRQRAKAIRVSTLWYAPR